MELAQLKHIFPAARPEWAEALSGAWASFGFSSRYAQAGYCGIVGNETGGLTRVRRENMNYSLERAIEVFSKARQNPATAEDRLAKGQEAFTNWIYEKIIGNGDEASGDGWKFRGGGIIQLTGRANYAACGAALGIDLLQVPDLLTSTPAISAAAAAWFMRDRAKILPLLESEREQDFLAGARKIGFPPPGATEIRLRYRALALEVL